jgi:hypothetical protein
MWHSLKIIVASVLLLSAAVSAAAQEFFNGKPSW